MIKKIITGIINFLLCFWMLFHLLEKQYYFLFFKKVDERLYECTKYVSKDSCSICIVESDDETIYVYGTNPEKMLGKIVYQADNVDIVVKIFKTFYAIETKGADFFYSCTTDLQFEPYDSHYYVFWVSGDNNSFYGRINRVIDMNMLKNKVKKFNVYVEKGE